MKDMFQIAPVETDKIEPLSEQYCPDTSSSEAGSSIEQSDNSLLPANSPTVVIEDELAKDDKNSSDAPTESKKKNLGNLFEMKMQQVQNES